MNSPIKWMGGKSHLSREIISRIPPHRTYIEAFAGGLHVLFGKPGSPVEVVNDLNGDLINLWMCVRDHLNEIEVYLSQLPISENLFRQFSRELGYTIPGSREEFPGDLSQDPIRAAKFYYLNRCSFNGIMRPGMSFSASPHRNISISRKDWYTIQSRMQDIIILKRDALETILVYDSPESFFYLDPPYLFDAGMNSYYEKTMSKSQHDHLPEILSGIKGQFLLSMNDTPEVRDLYSEFRILEIPVKYGGSELIILNYDPPEIPFYLSRDLSGIPSMITNGSRASFRIPNCPGCHSRKIQKLFARHSLGNGSRTFRKSGDLKCMDCGISFNPRDLSGIPSTAEELS